ncbi:unnamed protein product [Schistosoma mattheei]|uniref:Uncharacterized protein n=1 Tax=Schistosoma mattheei TaxID=31246 RepID=A0A183P6L6_9TREM|nr:unnamed protein product [Schistosoma mattheei]
MQSPHIRSTEDCPKHNSSETCQDAKPLNTTCFWCETANMCTTTSNYKDIHEFKVNGCRSKTMLNVNVSNEATLIVQDETTPTITEASPKINKLTETTRTNESDLEKTTSVAAASASVGLKGKSKILQYNTAWTNAVTLDGEDLEDVKTFTHLGSIIDEHGGSDADVKARIGKASAACLQLKNIWDLMQM